MNNENIGKIFATAGIGSILAGTFFGIVKNTILNQPSDPMLIFTIIVLFFFWYFITKLINNKLIENAQTKNIEQQNPQPNVTNHNKISPISGIFITVIIIVLLVFLGLGLLKGGEGNKAIMFYNILVVIMIFFAVLFSFFSGNRLQYTTKVEVIAYTFSYAIVFGILAPIFIFNNFSFKNSVTSTIIFFVWLSLTNSISNFVTTKPTYITRV